MIAVTFACGHAAGSRDGGVGTPTCETCGERRIARVSAPAPRFRGIASGPCVETIHLPPAAVNLKGKD